MYKSLIQPLPLVQNEESNKMTKKAQQPNFEARVKNEKNIKIHGASKLA